MKRLFTVIVLSALAAFSLGARDYALSSPDGSVRVKVSDGKSLAWSVSKDGATVMEPSEIGLEVNGRGVLGSKAVVTKLSRRSEDKVLEAIVPTKFREVRDRYNEMALRM